MLYSVNGIDPMFPNETRVLVTLPRDLADRARVLAGRATTSTRLPISLQIALRALIEEGLRHPTDPRLVANVSRQAETIRRLRRGGGRRPTAARTRAPRRSTA